MRLETTIQKCICAYSMHYHPHLIDGKGTVTVLPDDGPRPSGLISKVSELTPFRGQQINQRGPQSGTQRQTKRV